MEIKKSLILSSKGLKNISLNTFTDEDDFVLVFDEQQIRMKKIFAEFISPVISNLHHSDPTIEQIRFDDLYPNNSVEFKKFIKDILTEETISLLHEISNGSTIEINSSQSFQLRFLSILLGNEELFDKINELFLPDFSEANLDTYIEYIECCYNFSKLWPDFDFSGLLDYLSSNFYQIDEEKFLKLPRSIQYSIISNPKLQITTEDSFLDMINQIIEKEETTSEIDNFTFLEQIEFTGLSEEKLREFLSNFDFNLITSSLWKKLYQCFFIHFDQKIERISKRNSEKQVCEYDQNKTNRFDGIIQYLTNKFKGNVVDKGICKVTSSSLHDKAYSHDNYFPRNAVDFNKKYNVFSSHIGPNSWLKIDFIYRKVHPTHYSIQTWPNPKGQGHIQNWVIEGSNTDRDDDWKILDSRKNERSLDDKLAENTFNIQTQLEDNEYFRYLRIRQTGLNSHHTNQLIIGSLEFFGAII